MSYAKVNPKVGDLILKRSSMKYNDREFFLYLVLNDLRKRPLSIKLTDQGTLPFNSIQLYDRFKLVFLSFDSVEVDTDFSLYNKYEIL